MSKDAETEFCRLLNKRMANAIRVRMQHEIDFHEAFIGPLSDETKAAIEREIAKLENEIETDLMEDK